MMDDTRNEIKMRIITIIEVNKRDIITTIN